MPSPHNQEALARSRRGEQGVALVIVVWLVVLLTLQVGLLAAHVRDGLRLSENEAAAARGNAMAHAAIELAVARLNTRDERARWLPDGATHRIALAGLEAEVSINADNGRINLNRAAPELLAGLLRVLGLKPGEATSLANRIAEWRNGEQRSRTNGAQRGSYGSVRRGGPSETGFLDVSDVLRVPGISREVAAAMQPFVTVYTKDGRINPMLAAPEVLKALPGISGETLSEVLRLRRQGGAAATGIPALLAAASAHIDSGVGPAYRVGVRMGGGMRSAIGEGDVMIIPNLDAAAPYRVLAWRFGPASAGPGDGPTTSEPMTDGGAEGK